MECQAAIVFLLLNKILAFSDLRTTLDLYQQMKNITQTKYIIALAIITVVFAGCVRKVTCPSKAPAIILVNFPKVEQDSFTIKKYEPNNRFDKIVDSFVVISNYNSQYSTITSDSIIVNIYSDVNGYRTKYFEFDWEYYFPLSGKKFRVSKIVPDYNKKYRNDPYQCFSSVRRLYFNNEEVEFSYSYIFYFVK